jgi:hypothetical protein
LRGIYRNHENSDGRYAGDAAIQINAADLSAHLKRPRRGPKTGAVSRYAEADRALFDEMHRIIRADKVSATEAARQLVGADKVDGIGTDDSKARRLAAAYLAKTR